MNGKHATISPSATLKEAIQIINTTSKSGGEPGIGVIIDSDGKVLGVLTDGDIRNAVCTGLDLSTEVSHVMSKKFVHVSNELEPADQFRSAMRLLGNFKRLNDPRLSKVIVCTPDMKFVDIINLFELYKYGDIAMRKVAVYGLGFVGLTLALTFAELQQFYITGVDTNEELVKNLRAGIPPFHEKGLKSVLDYCLGSESIVFRRIEDKYEADIHIISVGTPVDEHNRPNFDFLISAGKRIGSVLKQGDLVICRSTVPVGTTRSRLIPALEQASSLVAGKDFFVSFAPERTVEGNALKELKSLPQIVGGLTKQCSELAMRFFQRINPMIVQVESLEAAEVVKLINNTFRDTVFAFANDVSLMCDQYNLNAFEVIQAANEGYPRNPIPLPSPGVGGICLAKDPHLYSFHPDADAGFKTHYGPLSRTVNQRMPDYVFKKFQDFTHQQNGTMKSIRPMIIGLAFKGLPETSDTRYSSAMDLIAKMRAAGVQEIMAYDAVLSDDQIKALGLKPVALKEGIKSANSAFVMNNHPDNADFNVYRALQEAQRPFFFFDGWNMFSRHEIEAIDGVTYATLGYATSLKA